MTAQEYVPNYILDVPMSDSLKQPGQAGTENENEITPEMVEAGASVLYELEGEASKERLAELVFLAMSAARL